MNMRMMRGRVMLHHMLTRPSALVEVPDHLLGTRGDRIMDDAAKLDRGQVRINVGQVIAIHEADARKYDLQPGDCVLYPMHSAQAPAWDQWDAICDECERDGRPYPQPPKGWRMSISDAQGMADLHGLQGAVVVVPAAKLLAHLPDGMPEPGAVR